MNRSRIGSVLVIVFLALIGLACSGNQPAANANVSNANGGTQPAAVNANTALSNANSATAENREYPQEVEDEFLKSCEESGSKRDFCVCVFDKVQQQYTFEEFSVIESKIIAGEPPEDFVEFTGKARAACTK